MLAVIYNTHCQHSLTTSLVPLKCVVSWQLYSLTYSTRGCYWLYTTCDTLTTNVHVIEMYMHTHGSDSLVLCFPISVSQSRVFFRSDLLSNLKSVINDMAGWLSHVLLLSSVTFCSTMQTIQEHWLVYKTWQLYTHPLQSLEYYAVQFTGKFEKWIMKIVFYFISNLVEEFLAILWEQNATNRMQQMRAKTFCQPNTQDL